MSKVVILFIILMASASIAQQSIIYKDVSITGKSVNKIVGQQETTLYGQLPVNIQNNASTYLMAVDSCTTEIDSLDLGALSWFDGDIFIIGTVKVKFTFTDKSFPAISTYRVYPNMLIPLGRVETASHPKMYIQRFDTSGTAVYQYKLRGK